MTTSKLASRLAALCAGILVGLAASAASAADAGDEADPEREQKGIHLSLSGGYFRPWDSADDGGFQIALSGLKAVGGDRFWVGGELEFRHSTVDVKGDFSPDYNSVLARFVFQYHPWSKATVSPYIGIGSGLVLHVVDRRARIAGERERFRHAVSGGFNLIGMLGAQMSFSEEIPISGFVEGRLDTTTDFWKKNGGNIQYDQVGGLTAAAGLRWTF